MNTAPIPKQHPVAGRWLHRAMWLLALTPFLLCAVYLTLVLHVGFATGAWPKFRYGLHGLDYSECHTLEFRAHLGIFRAALAFTLWATVPAWLTLVCIQRFRQGLVPGRLAGQAAAFVGGWFLTMFIAGHEIGRFFERLFNG